MTATAGWRIEATALTAEEHLSKKPDRTSSKKLRSDISTVADIGVKGMIGTVPGGSVLYDLLKARREELGRAMRGEAEKRLDALYVNILGAADEIVTDICRVLGAEGRKIPANV